MNESTTPRCDRCGGSTTFAGRISLPSTIIYGCEARGNQVWIGAGGQQQQQPQPQRDANENDDARRQQSGFRGDRDK
jgi:hypothetical protein